MPYLTALFIKPDKSWSFHGLREFTPEQFREYERISAEFAMLRKKFSLLLILEQNYSALDSFIKGAEASNTINIKMASTEANRHFMNYLCAGYTLREHLEASFEHDFGRNSEPFNKFKNFIGRMEAQYFEYAFFQDFRNFVQHYSFPVEKMNLSDTKEGYVLTLKFSKAALLKGYTHWKKSNLLKRKEVEFDLVALLKKHHQVVIEEFPSLILAQCGSNLGQIEAYFHGLQKEAKHINENAEAKLIMSLPNDPSHWDFKYEEIPKNPLAELGLSRTTIREEARS